MRNLFKFTCAIVVSGWTAAHAADGFPPQSEYLLSYETSELEGLTLGDERREDRLQIKELEFEFNFHYQIDDHWYAFFAGSVFDDIETVEPIDIVEEASGFERKQIGVGLSFGEEIESDLNVGRVEFLSISEWWLWWDEELDAIRLESSYGSFETVLGFAEEQARESTDLDRIDPEIDDVGRIIASLGWEFMPDQSLHFYYLDQEDDSKSLMIGDLEDFDKVDEEDADLTWTGISYLGDFETDALGELEIEIHYAKVSGDETLYDFLDPVAGQSEVDDRVENDIDGSARGFLLNWTPAQADDWSFIIGHAQGDREFRQTGLQGDAEIYGELYQPELSNLSIDTIGVEWEISEDIEIRLLHYEYEQDRALDEMRDTSIDFDPNGISKDLGKEIDLVITVESIAGMEMIFILAEFDAGKAYDSIDDTSYFWKFEVEYEF